MAECAVCGRTVAISDACPHCARPACADHRSPGAHDCEGVSADRTEGWIIDVDGRSPTVETGISAAGDDADRTGDGGALLSLLDRGRWLAAATVVLVAGVLLAAALQAGSATGLSESRAERLIAQEVNDARRDAGVGRLARNDTLARAGEAHSRDMASRGYVAHESPDGVGLSERYARFGLSCPGGENLYYGPRGGIASSERTLAEHVVRSWLGSPGHRETLLDDRFDEQGIGVVITDDGRLYVTQDLC